MIRIGRRDCTKEITPPSGYSTILYKTKWSSTYMAIAHAVNATVTYLAYTKEYFSVNKMLTKPNVKIAKRILVSFVTA
jgi:hypothetical protein